MTEDDPSQIVCAPLSFDPVSPLVCEHKNFDINFEMGKNETGYVARVRLWCSGCGQPFFFSGVGRVADGIKPHVEMDGTQVHLPLGAYYGPAEPVA